MAYQAIEVRKEAGICTLTLNRPEKMNAINAQMAEELIAALAEIAGQPDIGVLILTGAGRAFCSGGDIAEPLPLGDSVAEISRSLRRIYMGTTLRLHSMEIPTIAMVSGIASGWGFDLALACDLRIGSEKARFMVAFTRAGITPATGGVWLMPRVMGLPKAMEYTYTADNMEAEEALRLGVLNRLVPAEKLEAETMALARRIAQGPPIALKLAKMQLHRGLHTDLAAALETGAACQAICLTSEDYQEAVAAFKAKRPPVFRGK